MDADSPETLLLKDSLGFYNGWHCSTLILTLKDGCEVTRKEKKKKTSAP